MTVSPYLDAAGVRERISSGSPSSSDFTDAWIEGVVAEFEDLAETYCGVAFTPREQVDTVRVAGCPDRVVLSRPKVISITSLVVNAVTIDDSLYSVDAGPGIFYYSSFQHQYPATITYQHGYETTPESILRCCALYVEKVAAADRSTVTGDVRSQGVDFTSYVTVDWAGGRPTQWNEVNRLLNMQPRYATAGIG